MADDKDTKKGGENQPPPAAEAPKPTLRLAAHPREREAVPGTDRTRAAFHRPVTESAEVNQYGEPPIYFPDADEQKAGFTPLLVAARDGKPTHARYVVASSPEAAPEGVPVLHTLTVKTPNGSRLQLDAGSGDEATRRVLSLFPGIYKPFAEKA